LFQRRWYVTYDRDQGKTVCQLHWIRPLSWFTVTSPGFTTYEEAARWWNLRNMTVEKCLKLDLL
jgi:hypothetical protein